MKGADVLRLFEHDLGNRIFKSDLVNCNIATLQSIVSDWRALGYTIVFTAGVFDILTINHLLGLYNYRLMGGPKTRLIVSIDTDERVRNSKAFKLHKGGSVKPILSWSSRAMMVAKQTFDNRGSLVDLIVQHGSDTCGGMACPHDDNVSIAEAIEPDIIPVTSTSIDTIRKINQSTRLDSKLMVIIDEETLAYNDALLGKKISNSAIIERIRREG